MNKLKSIVFVIISSLIFSCVGIENKDSKINNIETKKQNPYNDQLKVTITRTGYFPSNVWKPCIELNIKNISQSTVEDYINLKVVFKDLDNGEILGEPTRRIVSGYQPLGAGNVISHSVFMPVIGKQGSTNKMQEKNIKAEIYIEDGFVNEIRIENQKFR